MVAKHLRQSLTVALEWHRDSTHLCQFVEKKCREVRSITTTAGGVIDFAGPALEVIDKFPHIRHRQRRIGYEHEWRPGHQDYRGKIPYGIIAEPTVQARRDGMRCLSCDLNGVSIWLSLGGVSGSDLSRCTWLVLDDNRTSKLILKPRSNNSRDNISQIPRLSRRRRWSEADQHSICRFRSQAKSR